MLWICFIFLSYFFIWKKQPTKQTKTKKNPNQTPSQVWTRRFQWVCFGFVILQQNKGRSDIFSYRCFQQFRCLTFTKLYSLKHWFTGNFAKTTSHSSRDNCQHWTNLQNPKEAEGLFILAKTITHRIAVAALECNFCRALLNLVFIKKKKKKNPQTTQKWNKSPANV